ncbi:hypothetical protein FDU21_03290 [Xanthomonas oryzae pv. oryzae]|nr:hypothetical protein FDU21_03290 [Xanthomonas oryzae pv. oryzae]
MHDYQPAWLDELCTAGRTLWARVRPGGGRSGAALRSTPIMLLPRRAAQRWSALARHADEAPLGSRAEHVMQVLHQQGALFFEEIADGAHLMTTELEDALSELLMRGRAHCDSYAGLRALLVPASKRPSALSRHRRRASALGIRDAGRWAPVCVARIAACRSRRAPSGHPRTRGAHVAASLWRGVLAAARTRSGVAAAMARIAAHVPTAGSAWRNPRRAFHRRAVRRAVRIARCDCRFAPCVHRRCRNSGSA